MKRTPVLAIILISYLMIVLDISIVITALPEIQRTLDFSAAGLSWVHNAYTLAFGGLLLLGARAGDILGRRRMLIIGLAIFTGASLVIGLAQYAAWLLAARAIQGAAAAILAPSTLALLTTSFAEGRERTRALAWYSAVAGIGASAGLVLGGLLTGWLSWRVGFFINVPIGIAVMFGAHRYLSETTRVTGAFDATGALSSTLGMGALVYGVVRALRPLAGSIPLRSALSAPASCCACCWYGMSRARRTPSCHYGYSRAANARPPTRPGYFSLAR